LLVDQALEENVSRLVSLSNTEEPPPFRRLRVVVVFVTVVSTERSEEGITIEEDLCSARRDGRAIVSVLIRRDRRDCGVGRRAL